MAAELNFRASFQGGNGRFDQRTSVSGLTNSIINTQDAVAGQNRTAYQRSLSFFLGTDPAVSYSSNQFTFNANAQDTGQVGQPLINTSLVLGENARNNTGTVSGAISQFSLLGSGNTIQLRNISAITSEILLGGRNNSLSLDNTNRLNLSMNGTNNTLNVTRGFGTLNFDGMNNQVNFSVKDNPESTSLFLNANLKNSELTIDLGAGRGNDVLDISASGSQFSGSNTVRVTRANVDDRIVVDSDVTFERQANGDIVIVDPSSHDRVTVASGVDLKIRFTATGAQDYRLSDIVSGRITVNRAQTAATVRINNANTLPSGGGAGSISVVQVNNGDTASESVSISGQGSVQTSQTTASGTTNNNFTGPTSTQTAPAGNTPVAASPAQPTASAGGGGGGTTPAAGSATVVQVNNGTQANQTVAVTGSATVQTSQTTASGTTNQTVSGTGTVQTGASTGTPASSIPLITQPVNSPSTSATSVRSPVVQVTPGITQASSANSVAGPTSVTSSASSSSTVSAGNRSSKSSFADTLDELLPLFLLQNILNGNSRRRSVSRSPFGAPMRRQPQPPFNLFLLFLLLDDNFLKR